MHGLLAPSFLGHGHHGGRVMVAKIAYLIVSWKQRERQEGPETRRSLKAYSQCPISSSQVLPTGSVQLPSQEAIKLRIYQWISPLMKR